MADYAKHEHHDFLGAVTQALADPPLQAALVRLTGTLLTASRRGFAALADSDKLRDHAKQIKAHTLAHLDQYLEQLEASVQRRGGHVHWAATAEEARQTVVGIARQANCLEDHWRPADCPRALGPRLRSLLSWASPSV